MAKGAVCAKCMVAWAIKESIKEYFTFIDSLKAKQNHAKTRYLWALYEGQIEVFRAVIEDHNSLIPYLQSEVDLRSKGNKGL